MSIREVQIKPAVAIAIDKTGPRPHSLNQIEVAHRAIGMAKIDACRNRHIDEKHRVRARTIGIRSMSLPRLPRSCPTGVLPLGIAEHQPHFSVRQRPQGRKSALGRLAFFALAQRRIGEYQTLLCLYVFRI